MNREPAPQPSPDAIWKSVSLQIIEHHEPELTIRSGSGPGELKLTTEGQTK